MNKLILMILLILSNYLEAQEFKLVELDEVSVEAYDIKAKRDHYFPEMGHKDWDKGANFLIKNHFLEYLYWNNRLHMASDHSQIVHVGWEFTFGLHLIPKYVDFYYYHHSEHVAEDAPPNTFEDQRRQFPVQDYIGFKFYLYRK